MYIAFLFIFPFLSCGPKVEPSSNVEHVVDPNIVSQGRNLFEQHILTIGGKTTIERHQNRIVVGKVRQFEQMSEWRFISYHTRDHHFMIWLQHPEHGIITKGYDGSNGWQGTGVNHANPTYESIDGIELQKLKQQADFFEYLNHSMWYPQIISVEEDNFAGRIAKRVRTQNYLNERQDIFFDAENHLLLGSVRFEPIIDPSEVLHQKKKSQTQQNINYQEVWVRYGHYVQVQDVYIPFSIEYSINGKNKVVLLEEAYFDVTSQERDFLFQKYNFAVGSNPFSSPFQ